MFGNIRSFAGNILNKIEDKMTIKKDETQAKSFLFDEDEQTYQLKVQTVRPLYEKKQSVKEGSKLPGAAHNLSQSMCMMPSQDFDLRQDHSIMAKQPTQPHLYKRIDTPKNIWEKKDLEEVLSYDDLQHGFDEEFRKSLETACVRKTGRSEGEVNMIKIADFLDKCKYLLIVKFTIDNSEREDEMVQSEDSVVASNDLHMHILNCDDEMYLSLLFNDLLSDIVKKKKNRDRSTEEGIDGGDSFSQEDEDEGSNAGSAKSGGSRMEIYLKRFVSKRDIVQRVLDGLNRKIAVVNKSIANIVSKRNNDFWGTCDDFIKIDEENDNLMHSVSDLRRKLPIIRTAVFEKWKVVRKLIENRKKIQTALEAVEGAKKKFKKILKFCKLDLINADINELPAIYEVLMLSYLNIKRDKRGHDFYSITTRMSDMILMRIEIMKKRLRGLLYQLISLYNQDLESPPSKELVNIFIIYNSISEKFKEAQEEYMEESQEFAEDAILLKANCFQLLHMDDTLHCIHSNIITDFF